MKFKKVEKLLFEPVEVKLTFETEQELAEFYAVFNYSPITDCLNHLDAFDIRNVLDVPLEVYEASHCRLRNGLRRSSD